MANIGDEVKVILDDHEETGILMPSSDENAIIIKLSTGYNIGFNKDKVKDIQVIKAKEPNSETKQNNIIKTKGSLPEIMILHTGGTIASKIDYKTGGVVARFTAEDLINMVPEISGIANIKSKMLFNMMSEDMDKNHYQIMAESICSLAHSGLKGIIVGHGTDTLAQTSAIISFMSENLPIPVIFVGSQRSSDRGSSDAASNLICAARFITQTDFAGVAICMHENSNDNSCVILPATKTKKMHTSRRDAFKAINTTPIATISYPEANIKYFSDYQKQEDTTDDLVLKANFEEKVAILKTYPGLRAEVFDFYREHGYKGVIIEGTGMGHAPVNSEEHKNVFEALKKLVDSGCVVGMTSNCVYGAVHENIYSNTRHLGEIGVIFCHDMHTETAYMKLAWLLGNYTSEEAKELLAQNLRGEMKEKAAYKESFTPNN